jgi:hypothetical protein
MQFNEFATRIRQQWPGAMPLRNDDAACDYEEATIEFERTGDRGTLLRRLIAVGVSRADAAWHVENPGCRKVCFLFEPLPKDRAAA